MKELPAWRVRLGRIIHDTQERQRIARALGISPITLTRWAKDISNPRPHNITHLLAALSEDVQIQLSREIAEEFPYLDSEDEELLAEDATHDILPEFYANIIRTYLTTPDTQLFWTLSNTILQQALGQLDPRNEGLAINVVQCMPPSGEQHKIRSLYARVGRGTPPWPINLEPLSIFLGQESLAGYVVSTGRSRVIQHEEEKHGLYPAHWFKWEESAAAYPITNATGIAGCLLVSSAQPDFFLSFRRSLIEKYVRVMVLLFEPEEFHDPDTIRLYTMPHYTRQREYLTRLHGRIAHIMAETGRRRQPVHILRAQLLALQQIEDELLRVEYSIAANE